MEKTAKQDLKKKLNIIIFGTDTRAGKLYDVILIAIILLSIITITMETIPGLSKPLFIVFRVLEYIFTFYFTLDYVLRVYCSPKPLKYIFSFFGIIDLISTLPLYIGFFLSGARYFTILRAFRLMRVFRIFKLFHFLSEGKYLLNSIAASGRKIIVFFLFLLILVVSIGTIMYIIEGGNPKSGFVSIPTSIYWAIVTMTSGIRRHYSAHRTGAFFLRICYVIRIHDYSSTYRNHLCQHD